MRYFKLLWMALLTVTVLNLNIATYQVQARTATVLGYGFDDHPEDELFAYKMALFFYDSAKAYTNKWLYRSLDLDLVWQAVAGWGEEPLSIAFVLAHGGYGSYYEPDLNNEHWCWHQANDPLHPGMILVWDDQVYKQGQFGAVSFVYMSCCHSAETIGWVGGEFEYGFPLAWLKTTYLTQDGYNNLLPSAGRFCFMGWAPYGPLPRVTVGGVYAADYNFTMNFFNYLFDGRHTIKQALNEAAQHTFGVNYLECPFYLGFVLEGETCYMRVFGNTEMNIAFIADFDCDGTVSISDLYRLNRAYGKTGPYNWDPVCDLYPDSNIKVNINDVYVFAEYYGKTYP